MCISGTTETVRHQHRHQAVSRRKFLGTGVAAVAGAAVAVAPAAAIAAPLPGRRRALDLTHVLRRDFPTFDGSVAVDEVVNDFDTTGFYSKRWELSEHMGTHIDTPGHFTEGLRLVDELTARELIAPIVVIDIAKKATSDPNAVVEPADLIAFERRHGRIPTGALVAMNSGWDAKAGDAGEFLGGPAFPDFNFPGFSVDATGWLVARRDPVGIGVDTVSLDPGNSTTFPVHFEFLGSDRYGVEGLANLGRLPPIGATVFVGPIPWEDGSGAPTRVLATW